MGIALNFHLETSSTFHNTLLSSSMRMIGSPANSMEGLTHYDVLDVAKDADAETIRKAYRKVRRVDD